MKVRVGVIVEVRAGVIVRIRVGVIVRVRLLQGLVLDSESASELGLVLL